MLLAPEMTYCQMWNPLGLPSFRIYVYYFKRVGTYLYTGDVLSGDNAIKWGTT
jgi:hypothetical protein